MSEAMPQPPAPNRDPSMGEQGPSLHELVEIARPALVETERIRDRYSDIRQETGWIPTPPLAVYRGSRDEGHPTILTAGVKEESSFSEPYDYSLPPNGIRVTSVPKPSEGREPSLDNILDTTRQTGAERKATRRAANEKIPSQLIATAKVTHGPHEGATLHLHKENSPNPRYEASIKIPQGEGEFRERKLASPEAGRAIIELAARQIILDARRDQARTEQELRAGGPRRSSQNPGGLSGRSSSGFAADPGLPFDIAAPFF